jgi:tetrahydromethanopterin S-methyltransferase subunit H
MIKQILDFIFRAPEPNIQNYQVPVLAKKAKVEVKSTGNNKTDEYGFAGEWLDNSRYEATNTQIKKASIEGLDKYDIAYLKNSGFNLQNPESQGKAQTIKRLWSAGHSSDQISRSMNNQRGWSPRSIDPYISAYFLADSRRFDETGKRIREQVGEAQSQSGAKRSAKKRKN